MNRIKKLIAHIITFIVCVYSLYNKQLITPFYYCIIGWSIIYAVEIPYVPWDMKYHHIITILIFYFLIINHYMYNDAKLFYSFIQCVQFVQLSDIFYCIYVLLPNTFFSGIRTKMKAFSQKHGPKL